MMKWISVKDRIPECSIDDEEFVIAFHTVHGVGVAYPWMFEEYIREELEEEFRSKYLFSAHFIKNKKDGNYCIDDEDNIDIFEDDPIFQNLGSITYWMPLPATPEKK